MIATEQCQTFVSQGVEVILPTSFHSARHIDLGILEPHIDLLMGNVLPAPLGIFENGYIETPFREVTKTPRH
ncbi:hypothetical protein ALP90_200012 [Pseudomonas amygdali pv. ulmi]|uniref:Uncharacterized protein n=1 Tax=Pseudomonas amygdali pv. ulmi TaxID=251720 RepID=A0A3M4TCD5_PSEA0|nr:hypothetical protein ALP90_200012 [Pseudomonas amygdali pv. ulmi]